MNSELVTASEYADGGIGRNTDLIEGAHAGGYYTVECRDADGNVKWVDTIKNAVCTEGKNAMLTHFLKGSAYTATAFMGLIESTGYGFAGANGSGVNATNIAASITAAGGGSPANGWNECPSAACAARGTPSFGTASAGALALSSALSFSITASVTIKGCFVIVRSAAGTASVATTGSTAGALYSAGLFTGGDKVLANLDTLSVSYTATIT